MEAGCKLEVNDLAAVVDAAHQSGAVCLIAHPGHKDGFVTYNVQMLDKLRQDIPIDGLEVYQPKHSAGTDNHVSGICPETPLTDQLGFGLTSS